MLPRASDCRNCPVLHQCTKSKNHRREIKRHVWDGHKEAVTEHSYEPRGKALHKRRRETVERSFADAKQLHGHRYARYRGIERAREQCLMAAICQNIKKMAFRGKKATTDDFLKGLKTFMRGLCAHVLSLCPQKKQTNRLNQLQRIPMPVH